jgi:hypothetical protein
MPPHDPHFHDCSHLIAGKPCGRETRPTRLEIFLEPWRGSAASNTEHKEPGAVSLWGA